MRRGEGEGSQAKMAHQGKMAGAQPNFFKNFEKMICAFREVSEKRVLNPKITLFCWIYTPHTLLEASQDAIQTFPIQKLPSWEASSKEWLMHIE